MAYKTSLFYNLHIICITDEIAREKVKEKLWELKNEQR